MLDAKVATTFGTAELHRHELGRAPRRPADVRRLRWRRLGCCEARARIEHGADGKVRVHRHIRIDAALDGHGDPAERTERSFDAIVLQRRIRARMSVRAPVLAAEHASAAAAERQEVELMA